MRQGHNRSTDDFSRFPPPGTLEFMGKSKKRRRTFVREWRKHRDLTQEQLAERVGVTQGAIAKLERGDMSYTQPMLEAIADALNCDVASLIMRDPTALDPIWSILDRISEDQKPLAARVLDAFTRKTGTDD